MSPKPRYPALTSLRFIAASAIVFSHTNHHFGLSYADAQVQNLGIMVSFFFVLSGFILTSVYPSLEGRGAVHRYLIARVARIWPAHLVAFGFALIATPDFAGLLPTVLNLTMLHAWVPYHHIYLSYNAPSWSISTEMGFYLVFPLLIQRFSMTFRWKLALAFFTVLAAALCCNLLGLPGLRPSVSEVTYVGIMYINPIARGCEFVLGMATAEWLRRHRHRLSFGPGLATVLELVAAALLAGFLYKADIFDRLVSSVPYLGRPAGQWVGEGGITAPFCALFILLMALQRGHLSASLTRPWCLLLGEISYSIYLLHVPLMRLLTRHRIWPLHALPDRVQLVVFWSLLLALSYLVWSRIETPARTWIVHRLTPRKLAVESS